MDSQKSRGKGDWYSAMGTIFLEEIQKSVHGSTSYYTAQNRNIVRLSNANPNCAFKKPKTIPGRALLPVLLITVVRLSGVLGAVGGLAGDPRRRANQIIARVAIGLRLLVVGLSRLRGLEKGLGGRLNLLWVESRGGLGGCWSISFGGFARSGLVIRILIPANFFLCRCSYMLVSKV